MDRGVTYLVKLCRGSVVLTMEIDMTVGVAIEETLEEEDSLTRG